VSVHSIGCTAAKKVSSCGVGIEPNRLEVVLPREMEMKACVSGRKKVWKDAGNFRVIRVGTAG
jgi:hypothetical protein